MSSRPSSTVESLIAKGQAVLEIEISELKKLASRINPSFAEAIFSLQDTLASNRKIVVLGVGKSENVAVKAVATFNSTGATAVILNCQNALHGDLGLISENDIILALSYSGETSEMISLLPHIKRRTSKIIAISGNPTSTLCKNSDLILDIHVTREACPLGLAPTSSSTNMLAICDALAMVLLEVRGFRDEDFAALHPGGNLGKQLLTRVADIMRTNKNFATADPGATVDECLFAMQKCKAGAVVLIDGDRQLAGVFTHGDFVRGYRKDRQIGDSKVFKHMSHDPVTIDQDTLAINAVKIIKNHRIDEIIALDSKGKVVGIIDVQDLSRVDLI